MKETSAQSNNSIEIQGTLFDLEDNSVSDLNGYRGVTVCKIVGISYRQLDYWTRTNLAISSINKAEGSGTKRLYSFKDIIMLKIIKNLLNTGISLQQIRIATEKLFELGVSDLSKITLMSDGVTIYHFTSNDDAIDLLRNGQGAFGISIGKVFSDVNAAVHALPSAPEAQFTQEDELAKLRKTAG
jgi:DNA-binding transcriptional MerR regulator